jgi:hypothetical protein
MTEQKLRISDIQTTELLYYDQDYAADCYEFCKQRDIDCLPAISEPSDFYYHRVDESKGFRLQSVETERRLPGFTYIFNPDLIDRFREHAVQFVYEHEELTGVVHFSDYNRPEVRIYLYALLAEYERNLRMLAIRSGLTNHDMKAYYEDMQEAVKGDSNQTWFFNKRLRRYEKIQQEAPQKPPFQGFYLNDLIRLINHRGIMTLDEKVVDLRNMIMHAEEMVHMVDVTTPDYVFDIDSFAAFFELVQTLLRDAKRVKNRIAFLGGLEEMGRPP